MGSVSLDVYDVNASNDDWPVAATATSHVCLSIGAAVTIEPMPPVALTAGGAVTLDASAPLALRQAITQALTIPNPAYLEAETHGYDTRELPARLLYYCHAPDGALVSAA